MDYFFPTSWHASCAVPREAASDEWTPREGTSATIMVIRETTNVWGLRPCASAASQACAGAKGDRP